MYIIFVGFLACYNIRTEKVQAVRPVPKYVSNLSGLEALHYDFLYIHVVDITEGGHHARNKIAVLHTFSRAGV